MESTTENMNVTPTPVAPAPTPVAQPTPAPAVQPAQPVAQTPAQPAPAVQTTQPAPAPAPAVQPAQTAAPQVMLTPDVPQEESEEEEEKKPEKLILNIQRILDDWKYEKGKVLIFLMKFLKVMVVLASISLFFMGFVGVLGFNVAISFLEPVAFLTRNASTSKIMLIGATFLTIWVSFADQFTPYFKAFSIAKWLTNNKVDPKEIMKIFLQTRREKELTKYKHGRGGITMEKTDLANAAFILLSDDHKKSFKSEMVSALIFWLVISVCKIFFVFLLSGALGGICTHVYEIVKKTAEFDFMKLFGYILNPLFLGVIGGWIVVGIASAITLACISWSRNKNQVKWVKAFMKEDLPSEEYYEE